MRIVVNWGGVLDILGLTHDTLRYMSHPMMLCGKHMVECSLTNLFTLHVCMVRSLVIKFFGSSFKINHSNLLHGPSESDELEQDREVLVVRRTVF